MPVSSRHYDCRKKDGKKKRKEKEVTNPRCRKEKISYKSNNFFSPLILFLFYRNVNIKKLKIFVVIFNIFTLLSF